ncbi:hypothetical protein [Sulfitobacter sp.]|uniref:hypothetical protein n=1 Tax=Sulfitobacter sp. TaxID=1903071 RepID=UPI0030017E9C
MKLELQHEYQEQMGKDAVQPQIEPDQEDLSEDHVVEALVQPDGQEQLKEDAVKQVNQQDQEEPPKGNMLIRWIKKITKKG